MAEGDKRRLLGLDVMRGIAMAVMLVVDATGEAYPTIGHAPWNGLHLADFVMPYFLLICGISASVSIRKRAELSTLPVFSRVFFRVLRLFLLGIMVQGSIFHITKEGPLLLLDLSTVRIMGILQRIAIVFRSLNFSSLHVELTLLELFCMRNNRALACGSFGALERGGW